MINFINKKKKQSSPIESINQKTENLKNNINTVMNTDITNPGSVIDSYDKILSKSKPVSPGGVYSRTAAKLLKHFKNANKDT